MPESSKLPFEQFQPCRPPPSSAHEAPLQRRWQTHLLPFAIGSNLRGLRANKTCNPSLPYFDAGTKVIDRLVDAEEAVV